MWPKIFSSEEWNRTLSALFYSRKSNWRLTPIKPLFWEILLQSYTLHAAPS